MVDTHEMSLPGVADLAVFTCSTTARAVQGGPGPRTHPLAWDFPRGVGSGRRAPVANLDPVPCGMTGGEPVVATP
jgi:hypothetical protein